MDRLFLDANVLFSAAYRPDAGVAKLWRLSRSTLFTSHFTAAEAERNLELPAQRERLSELLVSVHLVGTLELPASDRQGIVLPAKDWPVVGGALAAGATHLITGDHRHFGPFFGKRLLGVLVPPPGDYLRTGR